MCNFRPFNAHIQIFSYVFLNFPRQKLSFCKIHTGKSACCAAYARVSCHCEQKNGDPAGYCVPVGKRNKQAKDRQLSFTAIVWSKVQFMTCSVQRTLRHCEALPERESASKTIKRNSTKKSCYRIQQ